MYNRVQIDHASYTIDHTSPATCQVKVRVACPICVCNVPLTLQRPWTCLSLSLSLSLYIYIYIHTCAYRYRYCWRTHRSPDTVHKVCVLDPRIGCGTIGRVRARRVAPVRQSSKSSSRQFPVCPSSRPIKSSFVAATSVIDGRRCAAVRSRTRDRRFAFRASPNEPPSAEQFFGLENHQGQAWPSR